MTRENTEKRKPLVTMKQELAKVEKEHSKHHVEDGGSGESSTKPGKMVNGKQKRIPKLATVESEVLQSIVGQDEQVRKIITAVYRSIHFPSIKSNVLIIGNSGTGKTATIKEIAKQLHIPYTIEDATKYTQEGYEGNNVEDMIFNLLENANRDIEKAQQGMIIIDEIDKKAASGERLDVSGVEVLKSLLKMIEGTTIKIPDLDDMYSDTMYDFDTSHLIIIFMGAFPGLDKIRNKRLGRANVGFTAVAENTKQQEKYTKQDLVQYGMTEEFVGRIDTIVEMNKLTKQDLVKILTGSKLSIFGRYEKELKKRGITIFYPEDIFEHIAEASMSLDTGARELSNTVNYMFENILYEVFKYPQTYTKCTLSADIVADNTQYTLS